MSTLLCALLAFHLQAPLDEGTLVVREDTAEIAREAFRLTPARAGGWTLASTVRYDRTRPVVVLDPILEIGPDSAPANLQYTVADPREPLRILGQQTRGGPGHGARPRPGVTAAHHRHGGREPSRAPVALRERAVAEDRDPVAPADGGAGAGALTPSFRRATEVRLSRGETCGDRAAYEVTSERPVQGTS